MTGSLRRCRKTRQNPKNLVICARTREMTPSNHFEVVRRRRRSRRTGDNIAFWPPKATAKAGQHRLPGGQEVFGPGVLRLGSVTDPRFESHTTLQVSECILEYECNGQKNLGESPPRKVNSSEKVPREVRGSRVRGVLPPSRRKSHFLGVFPRK